MSGFDSIKLDLDAKLATATMWLNRPDKRNALNSDLFNSIAGELDRLRVNDAVRTVFIRGEGAAFCAGADLDEVRAIQTASANDNRTAAELARDCFLKLYSFPKPTVALVHGPALAGGAGLAGCCDFVIATHEATFGYPEVKIGFVPAIVMVFLTHQVGERNARDLCLSGRTIGADEAYRMGLVSKVVAPAELDSEAQTFAEHMRGNSPQAMATVKRLFGGIHGLGMEGALASAVDENAASRGTDDCREGIAAFLEKRKPKWAP